jgi:hypothetical protein
MSQIEGVLLLGKINGSTNTIAWQAIVDDSTASASLPRVVVLTDGSGEYCVTYKAHTQSSGEDIRCVFFSNGGAYINSTPYSYTGGVNFTQIQEYAISTDPSGYVSIVVRCTSQMPDNAIEFQGLNNAGSNLIAVHAAIPFRGFPNPHPWHRAYTWGMIPIHGDTLGGSSGCEFNPIIIWNSILSQYEIYWGDGSTSPAHLYGQVVYNPGAGWTTYYSAGGQWDTYVSLADPSIFYAKTCPGKFSGITDLGETVILYTYGTNALMKGSTLGSGGIFPSYYLNASSTVNVGFAGIWAPGANPSSPCGIVDNPQSGTVSYPVGFYIDAFNNLACFSGNITSGVAIAGTNSAAVTIGSMRCKSMVDINANGIFLAVPDNQQEDLFRVDPGTLAFGTLTTRAIRSFAGTALDAYFAASLGTGTLSSFNYEYGETGRYVAGYLSYLNPETDEYQRENSMTNTDYTYVSYVTNSSNVTPLNGLQSQAIETPTIHHAPHTNVWHQLRATVFENFHVDGSNDLMLGYRTSTAGPDPLPITIEPAQTDTLFLRPKCAVIYDGSENIAIVVYEALYVGVLPQSILKYRVINLDTRVVGGWTQLLPTKAGLDEYRTYDVTFDPSNLDYLFFFTEEDNTPPHADNTLFVAGIDYTGAELPWTTYPSLVSHTLHVELDHVHACFDPDPSNYGAYAVWRGTPTLPAANPGISFVQVATTTGATWAGGQIDNNYSYPTSRSQPVICAGTSWVLLAWEEFQSGGLPAINGLAYTNVGGTITGWNYLGGTQISPLATGYEARQPDLVAVPPLASSNKAIVAYETDNDPTQVSFTLLNLRRVVVQEIQINSEALLTNVMINPYRANGSITLAAGGAQTTGVSPIYTDAIESMTGYEERRPKLMFNDPGASFGFSPVTIPFSYPGIPLLMCTYETEAYNILSAAHPYVDLKLEEVANTPTMPQYTQGNISAVLLDPGHALAVVARYGVARNTNAQTLQAIYSTDSIPFTAAYTDYTQTDNSYGIAKTVDLSLDITQYHTFGASGYNLVWNTLAGSPPSEVLGYNVYNTSLYALEIDGGVGSTTCLPPTPYTWTLPNLSSDLTPQSNMYVNVEYTPQRGIGHNSDDLYMDVEPEVCNAAPSTDLPQFFVIGAAGTGSYKQSYGDPASDIRSLSLLLTSNPASSTTRIVLEGPPHQTVNLRIYNVLGQVVRQMNSLTSPSGSAELPVDLTGLATGTYVVSGETVGLTSKAMLSVEH